MVSCRLGGGVYCFPEVFFVFQNAVCGLTPGQVAQKRFRKGRVVRKQLLLHSCTFVKIWLEHSSSDASTRNASCRGLDVKKCCCVDLQAVGGWGGYCFAGGLANACSDAPSRHEEMHPDVRKYYCGNCLVTTAGFVVLLGGLLFPWQGY